MPRARKTKGGDVQRVRDGVRRESVQPVPAVQQEQPPDSRFRLVIVAPLPPKMLNPNARSAWQKKMTQVKKYRRDVGFAAVDARNRADQKQPFALARITLKYYFRTKGARDDDNLIAWAKAGIDALQDAKIVKNDRCLKQQPPEQYFDPKDPRLEIHLEGELYA